MNITNHFCRECQNSHTASCRDIFLYLSVRNILIFNGCLADKYKNMSLHVGRVEFFDTPFRGGL